MPRLYSRSISPSRSAIFFFTWLPHTAPELEPAASGSQASPSNPSPGAGGAGKDARCKSAQGSQPPSALTQVPKAARAAKDLEGLGRPGKTGIQGVLSPAQLSARLLRWEGEQRGRTAGLRGAHLNQIMFSEAFSQETTQGRTQIVQSSVAPLHSLHAIYPQAESRQKMTVAEPPPLAPGTFHLQL